MPNLHITEKEMMERNGVLDKIMDTAFDAAILVDRDANIIHCSKGSLELTKKTNEELRGTSIKDLDVQSPFEEVIQTGKAVQGLMVIINGRKCMTNLIPIIDNNIVIGVLGMVLFHNMTNLKRVLASLGDHLENMQTQKNMYDMLSRVDSNYTFDDYIGESKVIREMLDYCKRVAKSLYPVLIIGETGTGKEILANAFHSATLTNTFTPFVKINCSAIPRELLESELFGHEKGAFTGAAAAKKGKFELASGGTILLDEIGDMDLSLQSKLLRVIEEREYERVGGNTLIPLNARIIASTNQNLKQQIICGNFRRDLYYRLNTIEIDVPPLRKRTEDIPLLINHFLRKNSMKIKFTKSAMKLFEEYNWPGNARELRNIIDRFSLKQKEGVFNLETAKELLGMKVTDHLNPVDPALTSIGESEKGCIVKALEGTDYNISEAAKQLGISRSTLYSKIRKYNLQLNKILNKN